MNNEIRELYNNNMESLSFYYLQKAREFATTESYRNAFHFYVKSVEKFPSVRKVIEFEFRIVLIKLNEYIWAVEINKGEILTNFEVAMKTFPGNVNLLSDIGNHLYKCSHFLEALVHFERALQLDSSLVSIEKSLNNAKKILFSRAHFRLLNDKLRNRAYLEAIRTVVMPNAECVLDTDTGTGLSALYAGASGASSTAACDPSNSMAKLAERIMSDNNMRGVVVINKPATRLHLNDVYGERTLLITNKFDSGLFGDQLLRTLIHGWKNLLTEYGRVIPGKAEYYIMGAKCDRITWKYQVSSHAKKTLQVSDLHVHTQPYEHESYYGEDLNLYDDIEYMTQPQLLFRIDFNNYFDIKKKLNCPVPHKAYITAEKASEVNVLVGWFKLYLTDDVVLTTDPRSSTRCEAWQQAVFFDFIPMQLKENDVICLKFGTDKGKLRFIPDTRNVARLSAPTIAFLNDKEYVNAIVGCIPTATVYLGQIADPSDLEIADLSPFPLFGLLMMKRGARSLICYARNTCDKAFFEHVFIQNKIPLTKITILLADNWNHSMFKDQTYHVVFCNALDLSGDVDVRLSRVRHHLKYAHLVPGGLCLPENIALIGQLISSNWLNKHNRMSDDEKLSFRLAPQVNLFQVSQAKCIDPSRLKLRTLSVPTEMAVCCHTMRSGVVDVPVISDGVCNGVLCWYEVQLLQNDTGFSTRRSTSFVDSMVFLPNPKVKVFRGDTVNVIRSVDCDGSFKLVLDLDIG